MFPRYLALKKLDLHILRFWRYRVVFARYRVDRGRRHCWIFSIPGCDLPLSYLSLLKISHVFSRYWSIAGRHIKIRRTLFIVFRIFLQNVFGRFSRLAVLSLPPIPTQFIILPCFSDLCTSGLVTTQRRGIGQEWNLIWFFICLKSA
jgi:hypothetical protein